MLHIKTYILDTPKLFSKFTSQTCEKEKQLFLAKPSRVENILTSLARVDECIEYNAKRIRMTKPEGRYTSRARSSICHSCLNKYWSCHMPRIQAPMDTCKTQTFIIARIKALFGLRSPRDLENLSSARSSPFRDLMSFSIRYQEIALELRTIWNQLTYCSLTSKVTQNIKFFSEKEKVIF